jgi:hypothetical protein
MELTKRGGGPTAPMLPVLKICRLGSNHCCIRHKFSPTFTVVFQDCCWKREPVPRIVQPCLERVRIDNLPLGGVNQDLQAVLLQWLFWPQGARWKGARSPRRSAHLLVLRPFLQFCAPAAQRQCCMELCSAGQCPCKQVWKPAVVAGLAQCSGHHHRQNLCPYLGRDLLRGFARPSTEVGST